MNPLAWLAFPVVLGVLVFVHELGHFSAAKKFGVRVNEFAMGFPPRLLSYQRGETTYSLNAIPLGGYVKMTGENGDFADDPSSFGAHVWWQRAIILIAGPFMNIALAFVLFFIAAAWLGSPVGTNVVDQVEKNSPAQASGVRSGDRILAIDGVRTRDLDTIHNQTMRHSGKTEWLKIKRPGHPGYVYINVHVRKTTDPRKGAVGVQMTLREQTYSLGTAARMSVQGVAGFVTAIPTLIQGLGQHGAASVSGPVGVSRITTDSANAIPEYGVGQFLAFVALLSVNLGILNLLPIPALDGGRLLLVLVSAVRRRNLNPQVEGLIHLTGMAVLLLFIIFVSYHDLASWITGQ